MLLIVVEYSLHQDDNKSDDNQCNKLIVIKIDFKLDHFDWNPNFKYKNKVKRKAKKVCMIQM